MKPAKHLFIVAPLSRRFVVIIILLLLPIAPVSAASITVNSSCSLADAITSANSDSNTHNTNCTAGSGADTIVLTADVTADAHFTITDDLTIDGEDNTISDITLYVSTSKTNLAIKDLTLDGFYDDELNKRPIIQFNPNAAATLTISGSTIQGGDNSADGGGIVIQSYGSANISDSRITDNQSGGWGGAIYHSSLAAVTITDSTIDNNTADNGTDASGRGGGIAMWAAGGTLTITDSVIRDNFSPAAGGIYIRDSASTSISGSEISGNSAYAGGGIYSVQSITISGSSIDNNIVTERPTALGGGWGFGGAIYAGSTATSPPTVTVSGSSISGNQAVNGAGIRQNGQTVKISNSTLQGNSAAPGQGGAIYTSKGELTLTHVTIANNSAENGGGGLKIRNDVSVTAHARNTLIANNVAGSAQSDCDAPGGLTTNIGNYIEDGSCSPALSKGDDGNGARLASPSGSPAWLALRAGSQAIDAADADICDSLNPKVDQRGIGRPLGAACDIGAYEWRPPPPGRSDDDGDDGTPSNQASNSRAPQVPTPQPPPFGSVGSAKWIRHFAQMGIQSANAEQQALWASGDARVSAANICFWDYECTTAEQWEYGRNQAMHGHSDMAPYARPPAAVGRRGDGEFNLCYSAWKGGCQTEEDWVFGYESGREIYEGWMNGNGSRQSASAVGQPLHPAPPIISIQAANTLPQMSRILLNCMVTTEFILNFRRSPEGPLVHYVDPWGASVAGILPYNVTLTALERTERWFRVDYYGTRGWVHADYVSPQGDCG